MCPWYLCNRNCLRFRTVCYGIKGKVRRLMPHPGVNKSSIQVRDDSKLYGS